MWNKNLVIYITRNKVWVGDSEFEWDGTKLIPAFKKIKKRFKGGSAKIILGNDISYLATLKIDYEDLNEVEIFARTRSIIPEELDHGNVSWKVVGKAKGARLVTVFATPKKVLNSITSASQKSKINITSIQPISYLVAQAQAKKEPALVIWDGRESLGVIARKRVFYFAKDIKTQTAQNLEELLKYVHKEFGLAIKNVLFVGKMQNKPPLSSEWKIEKSKLDIFSQAKAKPLELKLFGNKSGVLEEGAFPKPKDRPHMGLIALIAMGLLVAGGIIGGVYYLGQQIGT